MRRIKWIIFEERRYGGDPPFWMTMWRGGGDVWLVAEEGWRPQRMTEREVRDWIMFYTKPQTFEGRGAYCAVRVVWETGEVDRWVVRNGFLLPEETAERLIGAILGEERRGGREDEEV